MTIRPSEKQELFWVVIGVHDKEDTLMAGLSWFCVTAT